MIALLLSTALFVGIHLFISGTRLRDQLIGAIGEGAYMGAFSLLSLGSFIWMCVSYSSAPGIVVWNHLPMVGPLTLVATLVAFLFAVIGMTTPSPTAAGGEKLLDSEEPATGILRVTRHPFLWSVVIWSTFHFIANGDAASLVFFGGLLVLGLAGPPSIDAKRARKFGGKWESFAAVTSNLPFAAIVSGRNKFVFSELKAWRIAAGGLAWIGMLMAHAWLFGANPLAY
jgi:uncharacterized membrane protein